MGSFVPGIRAPDVSNTEVRDWAQRWTGRYRGLITEEIFDSTGLTFEEIYHGILVPEYGIEVVRDVDLGFDSDGRRRLGASDPVTDTAYMSEWFSRKPKDPRRLFTELHETVGHLVFQGPWLRSEMERLGLRELRFASWEDEARLERIANIVAGVAAAPEYLIVSQMRRIMELGTKPIRFVGPGTYSLRAFGTDQDHYIGSFEELCDLLVRILHPRFGGLSKEALSYEVRQCRFVQDHSVVPERMPTFLYRTERGPRVRHREGLTLISTR